MNICWNIFIHHVKRHVMLLAIKQWHRQQHLTTRSRCIDWLIAPSMRQDPCCDIPRHAPMDPTTTTGAVCHVLTVHIYCLVWSSLPLPVTVLTLMSIIPHNRRMSLYQKERLSERQPNQLSSAKARPFMEVYVPYMCLERTFFLTGAYTCCHSTSPKELVFGCIFNLWNPYFIAQLE